MKETIEKFREYLNYIERHYDNVQKAWKLISDNCENKGLRFMQDDWVYKVIETQVKYHDYSKLSDKEFTQYRQYFFPVDGENKDKDLFKSAWKHHKENNDHHWQTWTKKVTNSSMYDDINLVHMLVDWIAMGFEFGDTAKEYYEKNKDEIELPDWAIKLMYEIFDCIYK